MAGPLRNSLGNVIYKVIGREKKLSLHIKKRIVY